MATDEEELTELTAYVWGLSCISYPNSNNLKGCSQEKIPSLASGDDVFPAPSLFSQILGTGLPQLQSLALPPLSTAGSQVVLVGQHQEGVPGCY